MKKKCILVAVVLLEILLGFVFFKCINTHKYDSWDKAKVLVKNIENYDNVYTAARSNQKKFCTISIDYLNNSNHIRFDKYYPDFEVGDNITVLYNPENPKDVVYLPYEEHCVSVKKRNVILIFSGIIGFTILTFWANRKEN